MAEEQWVQKGLVVPLPKPTRQLSFYLLEQVRKHESKTALVDAETGETVSGAQLLARSVAVALELRARGVAPGDIVSAALDNSLEVAYVLLGTFFAGAVYAPFNPDLHQDDIRHLLHLVEPKVVLCEERVAGSVRGALPQAQVVEVRPGNSDWEAFLSRPAAAAADFQINASDDLDSPLCIMFSSGTTGPPKGVMLSHRNWHVFLRSVQLVLQQTMSAEELAREVVVLVTTNTWLSGFMTVMMALCDGNPIVVFRKFDVDDLLASIQKHKITSMYLAPAMVAAVAKHPNVEKYDTSGMRVISFSGSALSPALQDLAQKRLKTPIMRYYGQTESLLVVLPGPKSNEKPGTIGTVAINAVMKIVDIETGKNVGPNTEGEICFKNPMTFAGYYKNPKATADTIDKDGWVHTGDAGYFDEDGYFFIVDRYKELIKYKGIQVPPADVENVLTAHEGVKDAAVVGIEHDEDQEHPVGFVVRQDGHHVTAEELHQLLRDQLPEYKQLHGGIYFIDEIPRSVNQKIKRRELRQMARKLRDEKS